MNESIFATTPLWVWPLWAVFLICQNFAFTFVSRARNSGSLKRHMLASIASNGIWFISFTVLFSVFGKVLEALKSGNLLEALAVGLFYTAFTMTGSISSHFFALRTEKGKSAVGANNRYKQITLAEWQGLQTILETVDTEIRHLYHRHDRLSVLVKNAYKEGLK